MKQINLKIVIIGILISCGVNILILPFIQTILGLATSIHFDQPLSHYLLWGYFPSVIAGVYIGFSKAKNKILNGALVGILYLPTWYLFIEIAMPSKYFDFDLLSFVYGLLRYGFACAIVSWCSYKIILWLSSKKRDRFNSDTIVKRDRHK